MSYGSGGLVGGNRGGSLVNGCLGSRANVVGRVVAVDGGSLSRGCKASDDSEGAHVDWWLVLSTLGLGTVKDRENE
jgi:hypothetical protein